MLDIRKGLLLVDGNYPSPRISLKIA